MNSTQTHHDKSLKVFYDGLCRFCSREINHYRKLPGSEKIEFVDITEPNFDAQKENLDPYQVHQVMHAKTLEGKTLTKVDAFVEIWKRIPKYHWAVKYAQNPLLHPILNLGYITFAKGIRPYLPKLKKDCQDSPYCDPSDKK